MYIWRKMILNHRKISWLLVFSLLILTLIPTHLHLHHDQEATYTSIPHEHMVDVHASINQIDQNHHENVTVIDTATSVIIKQLKDNPFTPLILLTFILLLALARQLVRQRRFKRIYFFDYNYYIAPPLRAPPTL